MLSLNRKTPQALTAITGNPVDETFDGQIGSFVRVMMPNGARVYLQSVVMHYPIVEGIMFPARDATRGGEYTFIVAQPGMILSLMGSSSWDEERISWMNDLIRKHQQRGA